jgi:hypothetical protein
MEFHLQPNFFNRYQEKQKSEKENKRKKERDYVLIWA